MTISGGIVADPEIIQDKVLKLRLAVDYSGSPREGEDQDNKSGYFGVTYFLNDDNPNTRFVKSQLDAGNFKKGSQISIVGRLQHDRWLSKENEKREAVVIFAESINYYGRKVEGGNKDGAEKEPQPAEAVADFKF